MTKYFVFLLSLLLPLSVQAKITAEELNEVLQEHPEIVINAIEKYQNKQAEDKDEKQKESLKKMDKDPDNISVGNANADIVLVEFFDFSCGYCKKLAPNIKNIIQKNPNIKVIFKPVTFVSSISPYAAKASVAAHNQGKFLEFYDNVMLMNSRINEKDIDNIAESIGLDMNRYRADVKSDKTAKILSNITNLARKLEVTGVPTLFLNGNAIHVYTESEIEDAIREAKQ